MRGRIQADVQEEVLFGLVQFLAAEHLVGFGVDSHQLAVGVGHVQAACGRIQCQTGTVFAGFGDGGAQGQVFAVYHPNHAGFTQPGDIQGVGGGVGYQLTRCQRFYRFGAFTRIQHQAAFDLTSFTVDGSDRVIDGVAEEQRVGFAVNGRAERFDIVVNDLGDIERLRIQTIHHAAFVQLAALRSGQIQRVLALAVDHLVSAFADGLAQQFRLALGQQRGGKQH